MCRHPGTRRSGGRSPPLACFPRPKWQRMECLEPPKGWSPRAGSTLRERQSWGVTGPARQRWGATAGKK